MTAVAAPPSFLVGRLTREVLDEAEPKRLECQARLWRVASVVTALAVGVLINLTGIACLLAAPAVVLGVGPEGPLLLGAGLAIAGTALFPRFLALIDKWKARSNEYRLQAAALREWRRAHNDLPTNPTELQQRAEHLRIPLAGITPASRPVIAKIICLRGAACTFQSLALRVRTSLEGSEGALPPTLCSRITIDETLRHVLIERAFYKALLRNPLFTGTMEDLRTIHQEPWDTRLSNLVRCASLSSQGEEEQVAANEHLSAATRYLTFRSAELPSYDTIALDQPGAENRLADTFSQAMQAYAQQHPQQTS